MRQIFNSPSHRVKPSLGRNKLNRDITGAVVLVKRLELSRLASTNKIHLNRAAEYIIRHRNIVSTLAFV